MGGSKRNDSRMQADKYGICVLMSVKLRLSIPPFLETVSSISLRSRVRQLEFCRRFRTRQRIPWPVVSLAPRLENRSLLVLLRVVRVGIMLT